MRQFLDTLSQNRVIVVAVLLIGVSIGAVFTLTQKPLYTASTLSFVGVSSADTVSDLSAASVFTNATVSSYADLATTPAVLGPVIEELKLRTTTDELARSVSATVPDGKVVITLTATWTSPSGAAAIANAVTRQLASTVTSLVPNVGSSQSNLKVSIVETAKPPTRPSYPNVPLVLVFCLLLSLIVALLWASLRRSVDTKVRSEGDIRDLESGPVLGTVWFDPATHERPVVGEGARAESYRSLRTNLQFLNADERPRTIVVTSSVAGEGKSVSAANIARTLAEAGERVLLVDADLRKPRIASYLGLDPTVGLADVLIGRVDLVKSLQFSGTDGLQVLPAGSPPPNPSELLQSANMQRLLRQVSELYDVTILDAPPIGPVTDATVVAHFTDGVLMICGIGKVRKQQVARSADQLANIGVRLLGYVANMVPTTRQNLQQYGYVSHPRGDTMAGRRFISSFVPRRSS